MIQQNNSAQNVSKSGYESEFAHIGEDMQNTDCHELEAQLKKLNFIEFARVCKELPNKKNFLTMHYKRNG
jgi:hypothetical protein